MRAKDDSDWYGASARDTSRARAAGLLTRPPQQTLADTLIWELSRAQPGPHGAGLTDEEEQNLLDALAQFDSRSACGMSWACGVGEGDLRPPRRSTLIVIVVTIRSQIVT